jgi:hypothetical protein
LKRDLGDAAKAFQLDREAFPDGDIQRSNSLWLWPSSFSGLGSVLSQVPKGEGVQFHDILYTLSLEILYTFARA